MRSTGNALVQSMEAAQAAGNPAAAQIVAAECVVLAETKDHLDWEFLGQVPRSCRGGAASCPAALTNSIEDEEDEHLYHTQGWCRELWLESLGSTPSCHPPKKNAM